jgi:chromosomal replication initiator protein
MLEKSINQNLNQEIQADTISWQNLKWQNFIAKLELVLGKEVFNKWFVKLTLYSLSEYEVIMSAPSKFLRDWIKREYLSNIKKILLEETPTLQKFAIIYIENQSQTEQENIGQANNQLKSASVSNNVVSLSKYDNVFAFGTDLNPKFTFENFIAGDSNQLVFKATKVMAGEHNESINISDINPLFLYGGVGLGKTHLGHAIAWYAKENNKKSKVIYLSAERFMHQFVQSIRNKDVVDFKEKFRSIDLLIIDDLQFIAGKDGTQEELLYTISSLVEDGKKVVLICDRSPGDLNNIGDKLKSRMSAGMIADFKCPNYETRLAILESKAKTINFEILLEILELLASKINSNVRDLEGAFKKLVANKVFTGEKINLQSANVLLQDLFRTNGSIITIGDIKKQVANHFLISAKDLESANRSRKFSRPRQIAMYLSKSLTNKSLPDIGSAFGGKNHATVIHAIKNIEKLTLEDIELANQVRSITDKISN